MAQKSTRKSLYFSAKSDFKSHFAMSRIIRIFLIFLSIEKNTLGEHFLLKNCVDIFHLKKLFSKIMLNFCHQDIHCFHKIHTMIYFEYVDFWQKSNQFWSIVEENPWPNWPRNLRAKGRNSCKWWRNKSPDTCLRSQEKQYWAPG